jgi:hypothetical protein
MPYDTLSYGWAIKFVDVYTSKSGQRGALTKRRVGSVTSQYEVLYSRKPIPSFKIISTATNGSTLGMLGSISSVWWLSEKSLSAS